MPVTSCWGPGCRAWGQGSSSASPWALPVPCSSRSRVTPWRRRTPWRSPVGHTSPSPWSRPSALRFRSGPRVGSPSSAVCSPRPWSWVWLEAPVPRRLGSCWRARPRRWRCRRGRRRCSSSSPRRRRVSSPGVRALSISSTAPRLCAAFRSSPSSPVLRSCCRGVWICSGSVMMPPRFSESRSGRLGPSASSSP